MMRNERFINFISLLYKIGILFNPCKYFEHVLEFNHNMQSEITIETNKNATLRLRYGYL